MHSIEALDVTGYRKEVIPSTLFRQEHEANHIAVLFPGFGYSGQMPLLYYPRQLLLESGADVFLVGYNYSQRPDYQSASAEERDLWLQTDTIAAYKVALAKRDYERMTLIGKSIGTRAIGHLLATEEPLPSLRCVWLTPILRNENLCAQIKQRPHRALFVVGTADSHYDPAMLAEVQQATAGEVMVIENADHTLEIKGDIVQSIHVLEGLIAEIQKFLG
jgi:predicted alpha/beta-hydrolase family hydrolase